MRQLSGIITMSSSTSISQLTSLGTAFVSTGATVTSLIGAGVMHVGGTVTTLLSMTGPTVLDITAGATVSALTIAGGSTVSIQSSTVNGIRLLGSTPITLSVSGNSRIGAIESDVPLSNLRIVGGDGATFGCLRFSQLLTSATFSFTGISFTSNACSFITCTGNVDGCVISVGGYSYHALSGFNAVSFGGMMSGSIDISWVASRLLVAGWPTTAAIATMNFNSGSTFRLFVQDCMDCTNCGGVPGVTKSLNMFVPRLLSTNDVEATSFSATILGSKLTITTPGSDISVIKIGRPGRSLTSPISVVVSDSVLTYYSGSFLHIAPSAGDPITVAITGGTLHNTNTNVIDDNAIIRADNFVSGISVTFGGTVSTVGEALTVAGTALTVDLIIPAGGRLVAGTGVAIIGDVGTVTISVSSTGSSMVVIDTTGGLAGPILSIAGVASSVYMTIESCQIKAGTNVVSSPNTISSLYVNAAAAVVAALSTVFSVNELGWGPNTFQFGPGTSVHAGSSVLRTGASSSKGFSWLNPCTELAPCGVFSTGSSPLFDIASSSLSSSMVISSTYTTFIYTTASLFKSSGSIAAVGSSNTVSFVSSSFTGSAPILVFGGAVAQLDIAMIGCSVTLTTNSLIGFGGSSVVTVSTTITGSTVTLRGAASSDAVMIALRPAVPSTPASVNLFSATIMGNELSLTATSGSVFLVSVYSPTSTMTTLQCSFFFTDITAYYSSSTAFSTTGVLFFGGLTTSASNIFAFQGLSVAEAFVPYNTVGIPSKRVLMHLSSTSTAIGSYFVLDCMSHPFVSALDYLLDVHGFLVAGTTISMMSCSFATTDATTFTSFFGSVTASSFTSVNVLITGSNLIFANLLPPNMGSHFNQISLQCVYSGTEAKRANSKLTSDYNGKVTAVSDPSGVGAGCSTLYTGCWVMPPPPTSTPSRSTSQSVSLSFEPLNLEVYDNPVFAVTKTYGATTVFHGASIGTLSQLVGTATIRSGAVVTVFNSYDIANIDSGGVVSTMAGFGTMNIAGTATQVTVSESVVTSAITVSGSTASVSDLTISAPATTVVIRNNAVVNSITIANSAESDITISVQSGGFLSSLLVSVAQTNFRLVASDSSTIGCIVFSESITNSIISMSGVTHTTSTCSFLRFNGFLISSLGITIDAQSVHSISGANHHAVHLAHTVGSLQFVSILWKRSQLSVVDAFAFFVGPTVQGTPSGLAITIEESRPCMSCSFAAGANLPNLKTMVNGLVRLGGNSVNSAVTISIISSAITSTATLITLTTSSFNLRVIAVDTISPLGGSFISVSSGNVVAFGSSATSFVLSTSGTSITTSAGSIIYIDTPNILSLSTITIASAWVSSSSTSAVVACSTCIMVSVTVLNELGGSVSALNGPGVFLFGASMQAVTIKASAMQSTAAVLGAYGSDGDIIRINGEAASLHIEVSGCLVTAQRSMVMSTGSVKGFSFLQSSSTVLTTSGGSTSVFGGFHFLSYIGGSTGDAATQAVFSFGEGCSFFAGGDASNFYMTSPSVVIGAASTSSSAAVTIATAGSGRVAYIPNSALSFTFTANFAVLSFRTGLLFGGELNAAGSHLFRFTNSQLYSVNGPLIEVTGPIHGSTSISIVASTIIAVSPNDCDVIVLRGLSDAPTLSVLLHATTVTVTSGLSASVLRLDGAGDISDLAVTVSGESTTFHVRTVATSDSTLTTSLVRLTSSTIVQSGTITFLDGIGSSFLDNTFGPGTASLLHLAGTSQLGYVSVHISNIVVTTPLTDVDGSSKRNFLVFDAATVVNSASISVECVTHPFVTESDTLFALFGVIIDSSITVQGARTQSHDAAAGIINADMDVSSAGNSLTLKAVNILATVILHSTATVGAFDSVTVTCGWNGGRQYPITEALFPGAVTGIVTIVPATTDCVAESSDGALGCWAFPTSSVSKSRSVSSTTSDSKSVPTQTQSNSFEPEHLLVYDSGVFAITKTYGTVEMFPGASVDTLEMRSGTRATIHAGASASTLIAKGTEVMIEYGASVTTINAMSGAVSVAGTASTVNAVGASTIAFLTGARVDSLHIEHANTEVSLSGAVTVLGMDFNGDGSTLTGITINAVGPGVVIGGIDASDRPLSETSLHFSEASLGCMTFFELLDSTFTVSGSSFESHACSFIAINSRLENSAIIVNSKSIVSVTSQNIHVMDIGMLSSSTIMMEQSKITATSTSVLNIGDVEGSDNEINVANVVDTCVGCGAGGTDVLLAVSGDSFLNLVAGVQSNAALSVRLSSSTFVVTDILINAQDGLHNCHVVVESSSIMTGGYFLLVDFVTAAVDIMDHCSITTIDSQMNCGDHAVQVGIEVSNVKIDSQTGSQWVLEGGLISISAAASNVAIVMDDSTYSAVGELYLCDGYTTRGLAITVTQQTVVSITDYDVIGVHTAFDVEILVSDSSQLTAIGEDFGRFLFSLATLSGIRVEVRDGVSFHGNAGVVCSAIGTTLASDGVTTLYNSMKILSGASLDVVEGGVLTVKGNLNSFEFTVAGTAAVRTSIQTAGPLVTVAGTQNNPISVQVTYADVTCASDSLFMIAQTAARPTFVLTNSDFICQANIFFEPAVPQGPINDPIVVAFSFTMSLCTISLRQSSSPSPSVVVGVHVVSMSRSPLLAYVSSFISLTSIRLIDLSSTPSDRSLLHIFSVSVSGLSFAAEDCSQFFAVTQTASFAPSAIVAGILIEGTTGDAYWDSSTALFSKTTIPAYDVTSSSLTASFFSTSSQHRRTLFFVNSATAFISGSSVEMNCFVHDSGISQQDSIMLIENAAFFSLMSVTLQKSFLRWGESHRSLIQFSTAAALLVSTTSVIIDATRLKLKDGATIVPWELLEDAQRLSSILLTCSWLSPNVPLADANFGALLRPSVDANDNGLSTTECIERADACWLFPTPTPSSTSSNSLTETQSFSGSSSQSSSHSETTSASTTQSFSHSSTETKQTSSRSATLSPSETVSSTVSNSASWSNTMSTSGSRLSPSMTWSITRRSSTPSVTGGTTTSTPTLTASPSMTSSATVSHTPSPSGSPTTTATASTTTTGSATVSIAATPTRSIPSQSRSLSSTPSPSGSPTSTHSSSTTLTKDSRTISDMATPTRSIPSHSTSFTLSPTDSSTPTSTSTKISSPSLSHSKHFSTLSASQRTTSFTTSHGVTVSNNTKTGTRSLSQSMTPSASISWSSTHSASASVRTNTHFPPSSTWSSTNSASSTHTDSYSWTHVLSLTANHMSPSTSKTFPSMSMSRSRTAHHAAPSRTMTRSPVPPSKSIVAHCAAIAHDEVIGMLPHLDVVNMSLITRDADSAWWAVSFITVMPRLHSDAALEASSSVVIHVAQQQGGGGGGNSLCLPSAFDIILRRIDNGTRVHPVTLHCPSSSTSLVTSLVFQVSLLDDASRYIHPAGQFSGSDFFEAPVPPFNSSRFSSSVIRITGVSGCSTAAFPSTADCPVDGGSMLSIDGAGFDSLEAVSFRISFSMQPSRRSATGATTTSLCSNVTVLSPSQISCVLGPGSGDRGNLTISATPSNNIIARKDAVLAYVPVYRCPTDLVVSPDGLECSGNGACDIYTGMCVCGASLSTGYWTGLACAQCGPAYVNSSDCRAACPVGSNSQICSGHGTCSNGACDACFPPYTGSLCELLCPITNGAVCNGHGTCNSDATCTCSSPAWTGEDCNLCAYGFVGAHCEQPCPVATPSGLVCNGQGLCLGDASGAVCACNATHCGHACEFSDGACSACSSPHLYGPSCLQVCPGTSSSPFKGIITTCSGNGYCLNGTAGSGRCVCSFGFGTDDCSQQCARNGSGVVCSSPRGSCNKADASCTCSAGYAGATCELACPTGTRMLSNGSVSSNEVAVCSSQGACDAVNGTCGCTAGYVGAACSVRCSDYCSHGECARVAPYSCRCHRTFALGFWAGASCDVCDAAYTGTGCTTLCPVDADSGLPCGGRGLCVASGPSAATCDCSVNRNGTWAGDTCSSCAPGYFGSACLSECPGSACLPCSGHGTCADGTTGTGLCSCFRTLSLGFWAGTE
ncbi:GPI-anchored surface protein, putative, partial [Bodo saltans]